MKKSIKTKWIKALRSGKYEQGRSVLNKDNKFCCLGVLCDLHSKTADGDAWLKCEGEGNLYLENREFLPYDVIWWAELDSINPKAGKESLSWYNDHHFPFSKIADLIEKYL